MVITVEKNIISPEKNLPLDRAFVINAVIRTFKGRRDVEVYLYRPLWDPTEENIYNWDLILTHSPGQTQQELQKSRQVVMESFTVEERDTIVEYLEDRYSRKLKLISSAPLSFPVPGGLTPLAMMPENENYGRIRFDRIPNYSLSFPVHGFYDLSAHAPILTDDR